MLLYFFANNEPKTGLAFFIYLMILAIVNILVSVILIVFSTNKKVITNTVYYLVASVTNLTISFVVFLNIGKENNIIFIAFAAGLFLLGAFMLLMSRINNPKLFSFKKTN